MSLVYLSQDGHYSTVSMRISTSALFMPLRKEEHQYTFYIERS